MPPDPLPRTRAILQEGIAAGLHIGAQLTVLLNGTPIADIALGRARLDGLPMRTDTLMLWLSAGKPITAAGIAILFDRGALRWDDPVTRFIPEFSPHGKNVITLRHLLTHTAGIRALDAQYPFLSWNDTLQHIYAMKIERDCNPGRRAGYHTHASWYLLGEIIQRITGEPCDAWLKREVFQPLGMNDSFLAMNTAQYVACETQGRLGTLINTASQPPVPMPNLDTQLAAARPRPSASCRGPIHDLARFYEMLRNHGALDGITLLQPDTVHALTSRQRVGMLDATFRCQIDWGFGFIINSSQYGAAIPYQFGPHASPDAFGHGGSQSSSAFCDPEKKLVVACLFNGCPGEAPHDRRLRATLKTLYEELFPS